MSVDKPKQPMDPAAVPAALDSSHYLAEYGTEFAERFDEYIGWEQRSAGEGRFFADQLTQRGVRTVLDVACGTGFHAVQLSRSGFEVTGVDGSVAMLCQAQRNARQRGVAFPTVQADWRHLDAAGLPRYDAVVCLGNSLTYLRPEDRRCVLVQFTARLNPGGVLVVDHRNYDAILKRGVEGFGYTGRYYYCGAAHSAPDHVSDDHTRFLIRLRDGAEFTTCMFPVLLDTLETQLHAAGLRAVQTFGDFKRPALGTPDFYVHVGHKPCE